MDAKYWYWREERKKRMEAETEGCDNEAPLNETAEDTTAAEDDIKKGK
jgi:hypothetical protein